jgi:truncated hemoglobin YjbI
MKITNAEFDASAGDLKGALEKFEVPEKEISEVLAIVGTTRGQIVNL